MHVGDAAPYVAGAYIVVFVALLFYMYLIGSKLSRLEARMRDLSDRETDEGEKK